MNNIADLLLQHPRPDRAVYSCRDRDYTVQHMIQWSQRLAHGLIQHGVAPGHTVVLRAAENLDWIAAFWALTTVGATTVMLPDNIDAKSWHDILLGHDIDFVLTDRDRPCGTVCCIRIQDLDGDLCESVPSYHYHSHDTVLCWASSGTSGNVKLISHTTESLLSGELGFQIYWRNVSGAQDHGVYCPARASTSMGFCFTVLAPLMLNYRAVLTGGLVELRDLPGLVARYHIQHLLLTPYVLDFAVKSSPPAVLSGVISVTSAAECLSNSLRNRFRERFNTQVYNLYGSSEMLLISMNTHSSTEYSVGTVMPHVDVRIVDEHSHVCEPGSVGVIQLRSATQFSGYLDDASTTQDVMRDAWVHSYDMGYQDHHGDLVLLGRANSCVKIRGRWQSLTAMEDQLMQTAAVQDCVLVPTVDHMGIPAIAAFIVSQNTDASMPGTIDHHVMASIDQIHCVSEIPRTPNMKKIRNFREIQQRAPLLA